MASDLIKKYFWNQGFDQQKLMSLLPGALSKKTTLYGPDSIADALQLTNKMIVDARITDIRFMAYMLATVCHESAQTKKYRIPKLNKDGSPAIDPKTKQPIIKTPNLWMLFEPVEEIGHGKGSNYFLPVKVAKDGDGALITEQDGDQFKVASDGKFKPVGNGVRGSAASGKVSDVYTKAQGDEKSYFGRGLVQLTWWNSYADMSPLLGRKLDLLFDPDLLLNFDISYDAMTKGMLEGKSFANGNKCSKYFTDSLTDYHNARDMVNSRDKLKLIETLAEAFEQLLLSARKKPA